jgi:hypothetical protein
MVLLNSETYAFRPELQGCPTAKDLVDLDDAT